MQETCVLALDLGATHLRTIAYSDRRGVLVRRRVPTGAAAGPRAVLARMAAEACLVRALSPCAARSFRAVGVGAPGPLDPARGLVLETPNLPGWRRVPVSASLKAALGLAVTLENDARCAAWGEHLHGAGKGCRDLAVFTLGTGVGGGLILDGRLRQGPDATAGEFGFLYVDPAGPTAGFGLPGSLEAYASATGLAARARQETAARKRGPLWRLCGGRPARITARMAHQALGLGDRGAAAAWRDGGRALGRTVAGLINALNLDAVVLAGGVMTGGGKELLALVRATARAGTYPQPWARCRVVAAELGDDAGAVGAAELALAAQRGRR